MKAERIFTEDIEVPGIVTQKAEAAFAQIRKDGTKPMKKTTKKKLWKTPAAVAASICLVLVGGISVAAAVQHFWGNAMEDEFTGTQEQKEKLEEAGVATVMADKEEYKDQAVTVNGVTITPNVVIADEHFAKVSFYVDGYTLEDGKTPDFKEMWAYMGDDPQERNLCWGAGFFNGILGEDDDAHYVDGSPVESTVNGDGYDSIIERYTDANGRMEYSFQLSHPDGVGSFLGQTLHFGFTDLGSFEGKMGDVQVDVKGTWEFSIPLSNTSMAKTVTVNKKVEGSAYTVDAVEISPISICVKMKVDEPLEVDTEDGNGALQVYGIVLKNGQQLENISGVNGAFSGFTDEDYNADSEHKYLVNEENGVIVVKNPPAAISMDGFNEIVEPDEVGGILLRSEQGETYVVEFDN